MIKCLKHNLRLLKEAYLIYGLSYTLKKVFAKLFQILKLPYIISFRYNNLKIYLFPTQLTHNIFADRKYRLEDTKIIEKYLTPGGVGIDVGTNIGTITLTMAKTVGFNGKVIGFEPSKRFFEFARKNIELNKFKNIDLYNIALGSKEAKYYLNESLGDDTSFYVSTTSLDQNNPEVDVYPLDEYTRKLPIINFLKIDVEGYEEEVLKGAKNTLEKTEFIYLEFSTSNFKNTGANPENILLLLKNFKLKYVDDKGCEKDFVYKGGDVETINLFGKRKL